MQSWPAIAIAWVKRIKNFTREIVKAETIKHICHAPTERIKPSLLLRGYMWIEGLGRRRKVIGAVRAHFMNIRMH